MIGEYGQLAKGIDTTAESPTKQRKKKIAEIKSRDSPVKKPSKKTEQPLPWAGRYEQHNEWHEMHFDSMLFNSHGDVWGHGSDGVGKFEIKGKVNNNREISFDKHYLGAHTVSYAGKMDEMHNIHGNWEIKGNPAKGQFELMKRVKHGLFKDMLPNLIMHKGSV